MDSRGGGTASLMHIAVASPRCTSLHIHSVTRQLFIEHLQCARHGSSSWRHHEGQSYGPHGVDILVKGAGKKQKNKENT